MLIVWYRPTGQRSATAVQRFIIYTSWYQELWHLQLAQAAKPLPKRLQKGDSRSCDGGEIALSDPDEACDRAGVHAGGLWVFGSAVRKPGAPSEGRYGQPGLSLRTGADRSLLSKATSVHDRVEWGRHVA